MDSFVVIAEAVITAVNLIALGVAFMVVKSCKELSQLWIGTLDKHIANLKDEL